MRKKAGLTQPQLAEKTGSTQAAVSQYENGKRPLTLDWMKIYARVIGCSVADLLDDEDNPDRLEQDERELVVHYRTANQIQREMISRVAAPTEGYRTTTREDAAA